MLLTSSVRRSEIAALQNVAFLLHAGDGALFPAMAARGSTAFQFPTWFLDRGCVYGLHSTRGRSLCYVYSLDRRDTRGIWREETGTKRHSDTIRVIP